MKFAEILAKHGVENAELVKALKTALDNSGRLPEGRATEIITQRDNLIADLLEKNAEIEQLKSKIETNQTKFTEEINGLTEYKTKWEGEETKRTAKIKTDWENKKKIFAIDSTDKRFEKVSEIKDSFVFAAEGEELTLEQMKSNLEKMVFLEKAKVFGTSEEAPNYDRGKVKKSDSHPEKKSNSERWIESMKPKK